MNDPLMTPSDAPGSDQRRGSMTASEAVVRAYLDAVQLARQRQATRDWQLVADRLAADMCWRFAGGWDDRLWPVQWRGRQQVLAHLRDPAASWSYLHTQTIAVLACGPVVLVEQVSTMVRQSGGKTVKPVAHVFTVVDGLVREIRTYRNDAPTP